MSSNVKQTRLHALASVTVHKVTPSKYLWVVDLLKRLFGGRSYTRGVQVCVV